MQDHTSSADFNLESFFLRHFRVHHISPADVAHPKEFDSNYFPKIGVSIHFLNNFVNACQDYFTLTNTLSTRSFIELTTTDVCESIIKPLTKRYQLSLSELLHQCEYPGIGKATVFISHAWKYKFIDVVNALQTHFHKSLDTIVWIDLFSINQHRWNKKTFAWWSTTLQQGIGTLGRTVMVLSPWHDPIPLTRAWCLWELYCTVTNGASFEVAFSDMDSKEMIEDLTKDCMGSLDKMRGQIDVMKSQCYLPEDRQMIFDAIQSANVNFLDLNRVVFECLQDWIIFTLREDYEELKTSLCEISEDAPFESVELAIKAGVLGQAYENQGELENAESLLLFSYEQFLRLKGNRDSQTLQAMVHLGSLYRIRGNCDKAKPLLEECLTLCEEHLGEYDAITLQAMNGVAGVYYELNDLDRVQQLTQRCYELRKITLGETHPDTLGSLNNLSSQYTVLGNHKKAFELNQQCYQICKQSLGNKHPQTLWSMHTLALQYEQMTDMRNNMKEAHELHEECYELRCSILGESHIDTLNVMHDLARIKLQLLDNNHNHSDDNNSSNDFINDAIVLFESCLQYRKMVLGDSHSDTLMTTENLAILYNRLGLYEDALTLYHELYRHYSNTSNNSSNSDDNDNNRESMISVIYEITQLYNSLGDNENAQLWYQLYLQHNNE